MAGAVVVSADGGICCPQALQKVLQVHLCTKWPGQAFLLLEPACKEELSLGGLLLFSDVALPLW